MDVRTLAFVGLTGLLVIALYSVSGAHGGTTASTGIIIPLYIYPGPAWTQVIQAKQAHPNVPFLVIINPNSGPGTAQDPNYVTGIQNLQNAGIAVMGYVWTQQGNILLSTAESQVNQYSSWYHVNGVFFDGMPSATGYEGYYSTLSAYSRSLGILTTGGNPGTVVPFSYIGTVSVLAIYENVGLPSVSSISAATGGNAKANFAILPYSTSFDKNFITNVSPYVGYLYLTDGNNDGRGGPWNVLPSYLSAEVAALDVGH